MTEARFDDLRFTAPRSFRFADQVGTIQAHEPAEIPEAMHLVEEAGARGEWVAGYVAYEAAPGFDARLKVRGRASEDAFAALPLLWFGCFNQREDVAPLRAPQATFGVWRWDPSVSRASYEEQIEVIRDHILAGDSYQVNHTMRLRGAFAGTDRAFYTALALAQRGGHCAYLDLGRYRVLSASPELFFRLDADGTLTTRPMKGTARRGRWPAEDTGYASALLASEKERAENAMIVDLLRNDMGKISETGTVDVTDLFAVERYETVWQLTSTIRSQLRAGLRITDVFDALFPSGSVTGAPKVRSMEIIADLETMPRGIYCGAIGWIAPHEETSREARAEFNVAIRTVVLDTETDVAEYGVGGGITFESEPAREYEESVAKSRVLTERRPEFWLLETIGYADGVFLWLDRHLARLRASAEAFSFACDLDAVQAAAEDAVAAIRHGVLRLTLDRDGAITTSTRPLPAATSEPVTLAIDESEPIDADDVFWFHKTTRRAPYERRAARFPEVDDVVLVNAAGEVTETTIANIAARIGGHWVTPPLACGLLPGIYREVLLESGELREQALTVQEFRAAEEIAVLSSVRRWRTARLVDV